jgi:hypothetical protein
MSLPAVRYRVLHGVVNNVTLGWVDDAFGCKCARFHSKAANDHAGRLLRYVHWSIAADSPVRSSSNENYRSNFYSYAQTNSPTGSGWTNRWDFHANVEDWFVRRYFTAICPTVSGTYGFR